MSKFLVAKKKLELTEANNKPKLLVSKRVTEISNSAIPQFSVIKKYSEIETTVSFDSCGGSFVEDIEFIVGKTYSNLPTPTKTQHIFLGWYTQVSGGTKITSNSIVSANISKLYAQWELVDIDSANCTSYEVITNSSYKNTGIYSATIKSSSSPIYIDWGDGSVEKLTSSISQKSHTYSSVGTFTVKISNNITSFQPSYSDSTWYGTTSQNRYTFNKMISTGSNITSLPSYAFYYCQKMTNIDFMQTCFTNITSLPSYCFYYCTGLTSIQGAKRFTSLGSYCFYYCTGLSGTQDLSNFNFTSLTNSYVFAYCSNVKRWILPTGFNGTYFGSYMFQSNTQLSGFNLPTSLTALGSYCFNSCSNLKSIIIPQNVKTINERSFYSCTSLTSIDYQTTALTSIGNYAFYQCYANNSLSIPDTVKSIGNYAFYYNYNANATDLNLPSQLTSLGTYAYQYCYNLKNLSIPSALTSIGDYAFAGCYRLSSIIDNRLTAQTVGANTFGNTTGTGTNAYTGYSTRGNNKLSVYVAATGYDESYWNDPLQNPDKCGFEIDYLDPENLRYCTVTFNAGNGQFTINNSSIRYVKLIINENYGDVCLQISRLELIKSDGTNFNWSSTKTSYIGTFNWSNNEQIDKALDHDVNTKLCIKDFILPVSFIFDVGENNVFNINDISHWQWWTANDTASYSGRNPKSFTLQFSTDGINYVTVDEVTNYSAPAQSNVVGYEGTIKNKDQFSSNEDEITTTKTIQVIQGKKIGTLPTPICPDETPYFGGWYTDENGTGEKYKADSLAPNQDTLTLYAYYGATPFASYTVDLNGQWVKSTSQSNPDDSQYDGVYESNSNYNVNNGWAKMYIRISGYTQFTIYIRSYAESNYDYVVAMNLDVDVTSNPSYTTTGVKAHTRGNQQSSTAIGSYTKVEYNNIDGGEHFICIVYRKDSSVNNGNDRGYVLIEQPANPINITFDIGNGELVSGNLTAIGYQGRPIGNILPKVEGNSDSPYFIEWNTMSDGSGDAYSSDTMLPISSTLTLYAIYSDQFPYTFIEYLESTGTQWIDTGIRCDQLNSNFKIKCVIDLLVIGDSSLPTIFGMENSNEALNFPSISWRIVNYGVVQVAIGNQWTDAGIDAILSNTYTLELDNSQKKYTITNNTNNTIVSKEYADNDAYKINLNLFLFGLNMDGSATRCSITRIKSFIIENQLDLVPVRKGNVGYMYDMISGKIFENSGTGSFILGPDKATEPIEDILCFEAVEANSTISMQAVGDAPAVSLKTTTDGILWKDFIVGQTTICLVDVGDKVYFKAKEDNLQFATSTTVYNNFVMTGKIKASGNIQSLLYKDELLDEINSEFCFSSLFKNCLSLITTPQLPSTTLQTCCYYQLFGGCKALTYAPELPATILASFCYSGMFEGCTSLTQAPELPAMSLAGGCYECMFRSCTSLTQAPELPATTLVSRCYEAMFSYCTSLKYIPDLSYITILANKSCSNMFYNCTSLTDTPHLTVNTLTTNCYAGMFSGCTKLSSIEVDFTDWKDDLGATTDWLKNVAPTGTFTCPLILPETYGTSYIPEGWTLLRNDDPRSSLAIDDNSILYSENKDYIIATEF